MATKRYILYVEDESQVKILSDKTIRIQTHIQEVNKLGEIPDWLNDLPLPVFVDKLKKEAYFGENTLRELFNKKPKAIQFEDE
jgi:hypothetical protein